MRRRRFLGFLPLAALATARCGGGGDAQVVVERPVRTPAQLVPDGPTPTPVPPPEVLFSAEQVYQGGTSLLSLLGDVTDGAVTFLGRRRPLTRGTRSIYAFLGVGTDDPPGTAPIRIEFTLSTGSSGTLESGLTVLETAWTRDDVTIAPDLATILLDPAISAKEVALLEEIYSTVTPEKLWLSETGWHLPLNGPLTTRFGEERSYNGGPVTGHHGGTDLGAEAGTPVGATNRGRVVMARQLQLRGNMVVVDHGGGVLSGYAHLASFSVAEGQLVEQDQAVGLVGSSGLSTGAHLHWEMAAGGVLVDALRFTDGTNGF